MIEWSAEKIANLKTVDEIKSLKANATKRAEDTVVEMCEAELRRRNPVKPKRPAKEKSAEDRTGQYVQEFHFVCPNESEVKKDAAGLIRSGTWVVAEANAEAAVKYGSLIALHTARAEPSYLQGTIRGWNKQARQPRNADGELVGHEFGIEFQFEPTSSPLPWKGDASAEKGYAWAPIPD